MPKQPTNPILRCLVVWGRGASVLIVISMSVGVAGALVQMPFWLAGALLNFDASPFATIAVLFIIPWMAGNRKFLEWIGGFADIGGHDGDGRADTVPPSGA